MKKRYRKQEIVFEDALLPSIRWPDCTCMSESDFNAILSLNFKEFKNGSPIAHPLGHWRRGFNALQTYPEDARTSLSYIRDYYNHADMEPMAKNQRLALIDIQVAASYVFEGINASKPPPKKNKEKISRSLIEYGLKMANKVEGQYYWKGYINEKVADFYADRPDSRNTFMRQALEHYTSALAEVPADKVNELQNKRIELQTELAKRNLKTGQYQMSYLDFVDAGATLQFLINDELAKEEQDLEVLLKYWRRYLQFIKDPLDIFMMHNEELDNPESVRQDLAEIEDFIYRSLRKIEINGWFGYVYRVSEFKRNLDTIPKDENEKESENDVSEPPPPGLLPRSRSSKSLSSDIVLSSDSEEEALRSNSSSSSPLHYTSSDTEAGSDEDHDKDKEAEELTTNGRATETEVTNVLATLYKSNRGEKRAREGRNSCTTTEMTYYKRRRSATRDIADTQR